MLQEYIDNTQDFNTQHISVSVVIEMLCVAFCLKVVNFVDPRGNQSPEEKPYYIAI